MASINLKVFSWISVFHNPLGRCCEKENYGSPYQFLYLISEFYPLFFLSLLVIYLCQSSVPLSEWYAFHSLRFVFLAYAELTFLLFLF